MVLAGIEAGGTKFVCAVATSPTTIIKEVRFPTTTPQETLAKAREFFLTAQHELIDQYGPISGLGIGCFGPLDLDRSSSTYGSVTSTPKIGWSGTNLIKEFNSFQIPIGFDTDTNGAALGEALYGAGIGLDSILYITVGTGIGGGIVLNGKPVHGLIHPELGHIPVPIHPDDTFSGVCPYHQNCLEGMASGPSIERRWGISAKDLPPDHPAWDLEAYYLAKGLMSWILTVSPQRIIMGGGVMAQLHLFPLIRKYLKTFLAGYIDRSEILEDNDTYIVVPEREHQAGIIGALALAQLALENETNGREK
jgi:fructokinase